MALFDIISALLDHPIVKFGTMAISIASLVTAYLAFKKTGDAVENYWKNVRGEQARFLESQWNATYRLTMTSPDFARETAKIFGLPDEAAAKGEAALLTYINLCAMAFNAHQAGVIDKSTRDAHLRSFFAHYKGNRERLEKVLSLEGYDTAFRAECRRQLASLG